MLWFGPGWKIPPYFYVLFGEEPNPIGITMKRPWSWALCFVIIYRSILLLLRYFVFAFFVTSLEGNWRNKSYRFKYHVEQIIV